MEFCLVRELQHFLPVYKVPAGFCQLSVFFSSVTQTDHFEYICYKFTFQPEIIGPRSSVYTCLKIALVTTNVFDVGLQNAWGRAVNLRNSLNRMCPLLQSYSVTTDSKKRLDTVNSILECKNDSRYLQFKYCNKFDKRVARQHLRKHCRTRNNR